MPTVIPALTGKAVADLVTLQLAGTGNAHDPGGYISLINVAKDKVRRVVAALREDYFVVASQTTTSGDDDYFAALSTTVREYSLPRGFLRIRFIEVLTSGYENCEFVYRPMNHPDFKGQRRNSTNNSPSIADPTYRYYYTIVGQNKFVMAAYPAVALTLKLWFERQLPDIELEEPIPELLHPFIAAMADFVVGRLTLMDNRESYAAWLMEWKNDLREIEAESKQRNIADPQVVTDFDEFNS
jgi:hypothetical protein